MPILGTVASGYFEPPAATGLFATGGDTNTNTIDYVTISTLGNAVDFASLSVQRGAMGGCASSTRGVFGAGVNDGGISNVIDYLTISAGGTATDFGDVTAARYLPSGLSNSTRGVFGGGWIGSNLNVVDYITIATTGNATSFGSLSSARFYDAACASPTRGIFAGGNGPSGGATFVNNIDYITIATTGNGTSFGTLGTNRENLAGASNSVRGIFSGGNNPSPTDVIEYLTIATTGNGTSFGNLPGGKPGVASVSSSTRVLIAGTNNPAFNRKLIQYVEIATTGNSVDFGELTINRTRATPCSNSHGGL